MSAPEYGTIYERPPQAAPAAEPVGTPPTRPAAQNNAPSQAARPLAILPAGSVVISARTLIAGVIIVSLIIFLFLLFWESFGKEAATLVPYGPVALQMRDAVDELDEAIPGSTLAASCAQMRDICSPCHPLQDFPPQACSGSDPCPNALGWPNYGSVETPGDGEEMAYLYQRAASVAVETGGLGAGRHSRADLRAPDTCDTDAPYVRGRTTYAGYRHSSALL